jgi:hypothetical protein
VSAGILQSALDPVTGGKLATEGPDEILRRATMIGEVSNGKPGALIRKHLFDGAPRVDRAVGALTVFRLA